MQYVHLALALCAVAGDVVSYRTRSERAAAIAIVFGVLAVLALIVDR